MAKYLLLKHYRGAPAAVNDVPMDQWTPEEVSAHMRYMQDFATRLAQELLPLAVLLDIRLPRTDGWEVLKRVRADAATAAVPVIVVSIVDERARGLALGASAYLVKPVQREVLVGALRDVGAFAGVAAAAGPGESP